MLFNILASISLIIVIILLRRLVNIFPSLLACTIRWKENVNLDASLKLRLDRNKLAAAMVIPFGLLVYRYGLYEPRFLTGLNEAAQILVILGILITFIVLRQVLWFAARPKKSRTAAYDTAHSSSSTFFIILTLFMLAASAIFSFFDANMFVAKNAMIWISAGIYLMFMLRKIQIFTSSYHFLAVFLYLCALEILPTGVLVSSVVIF